ncbi:hypothetical protein Clacol_001853 [Clathrus columnatus]|uniref:XPG-I domain-containing protein n=1 Tax=Clathrus columnatus TaxID=1419009 RepID=A0AAV4ZZ79_9AGAM|nr:hypothetical protein Clacol_001853 [Clathrus columnatus]
MGVPGLWDLLRPCGETYSLLNLAVDSGFLKNQNGHRAYRLGIDASIWFFHAQGGREGENPELRTIFFRCARLLAMPFLPLFVFDGPKRPKVKRGKVIGGNEHWMINSLRTILDAFGFECRTAPGEAEAELAYLNRIGVIDAVLSDDVDCFVFGAPTVIRNLSSTLSAGKGKGGPQGKEDGQHVNIYRLEDIKTHTEVNLTQGGLILIALLRGGDYDQQGIDGCGVHIAQALAKAGFGDSLLLAARSNTPGYLEEFLPQWRKDLRAELATNASGFAPRKSPTVAKRITHDFPRLDILRYYTHPVTSESEHNTPRGLDSLWKKRADVAKIARVCELYFEWGVEAKIIKRFRSFLWPGVVLRTLLYTALDNGKEDHLRATQEERILETPSKALARHLNRVGLNSNFDVNQTIATIHSERAHKSTDSLLEYRLEINPKEFVSRARSGIQGTRVETRDSAAADSFDEEESDGEGGSGGKKGASGTDPDSTLRVWMPAAMVAHVCPTLVDNFVIAKAAKGKRKKGTTKAKTSSPEKVPKAKSGGKQSKIDIFTQTKATSQLPSIPLTVPAERPPPRAKLQCILERLENDPFIASMAIPSKTASSRTESKASSNPGFGNLRPFPMTLSSRFEDEDNLFNPISIPNNPSGPSRIRKQSSTSGSSSDKSNLSKSPVNKSPRKSKNQTSPLARSASTQPPLKLPIRPLELLKQRSEKSKRRDSEIIIISSDSDSEVVLEKKMFAKKTAATRVLDFVDLT